MACVFIWNPAFSAFTATASMNFGSLTSRPLFFASSLYGSSSAAPREPSAPSE